MQNTDTSVFCLAYLHPFKTASNQFSLQENWFLHTDIFIFFIGVKCKQRTTRVGKGINLWNQDLSSRFNHCWHSWVRMIMGYQCFQPNASAPQKSRNRKRNHLSVEQFCTQLCFQTLFIIFALSYSFTVLSKSRGWKALVCQLACKSMIRDEEINMCVSGYHINESSHNGLTVHICYICVCTYTYIKRI